MAKDKIGVAMDFLDVLERALHILEYNERTKPPELEDKLNDGALSIVSRWYATYEPIKYRRSMSLKHAFKITRDGIDVILNLDASNMGGGHHQSDAWVYHNSFEEGYHGGSIGTDKAGYSVSTPSWRSPYGYYIHWGDPAPKSFSPKDEIEKMAKEYIKEYDSEWHKILYDEVLNPILASYKKFKACYK